MLLKVFHLLFLCITSSKSCPFGRHFILLLLATALTHWCDRVSFDASDKRQTAPLTTNRFIQERTINRRELCLWEETSQSKAHASKFDWILLCTCEWKGVFLLYVCMCVKGNVWPFSQRINRSSVAAVTGKIRDMLCPCLCHHPSSSAMSVHVRPCMCTTVGINSVCVYTLVEELSRRMIEEAEER